MKNLNSAAFSLMEVILASVIFVVSIAGIFATLNAVRTPVANGENNLAAAVFGKQVLEALRAKVNYADPRYTTCSAGGNSWATCPDFSLSLSTVPGAQHVVNKATLNANNLIWPVSLTALNGGAVNPVLKYTVSCGDGPLCPDPNAARRVDLNITY